MPMIRLLLLFLTLNLGLQARAEFIETEFTSGGHSFRAEGMTNFKYPFVTIADDHLLLITHASSYWDVNKVTWKGIKPLVDFFRGSNLPVKYLVSVHEKAMKPTYPAGISDKDLHPFQGDSHRIILRGKSLVMTGGNFTICACNATRSIIALSESQEALSVYFAMDGIYEGQKGVVRTLFDISNEKNDREFMRYLQDVFFNRDGLPCKDPTLFAIDRTFHYKIYRNDQLVGRYGHGNTEVKLFFLSSRDILQHL